MNDEYTKLRERLSKLRILVERGHSVDFDFVKNYLNRGSSKTKNVCRVRPEHRFSMRHRLVEELALTSQFLEKSRNVLKSWELELLHRFESYPESDVLAWIRNEWKETWSTEDLKKEILKIKNKIGSKNEKVVPQKKQERTFEVPRMVDMIRETVVELNKLFLGKK